METVNNAVNAASKMIWGDSAAETTKQTDEPVSGETGAGTLTEPYDKGNTDASITSDTTTTPNIGSTAPSSGTTASSVPDSTTANTGSLPIRPKPEASSITATAPAETSSKTLGDKIDPIAATVPSTTTDPTSNTLPSTSNPATAAHSTSTEVGQKQQGADRPTEAPSAAQTEAVKEKSNIGEKIQESDVKVTDDNREQLAAAGKLPTLPNDHSGEPMKMHTSAAKETSAGGTDPRTEAKKDRSASVSHEGGGQHGKSEGTGEQWVKTSGLAAEGGDFDATKPGAGKEANRILEEKGIKNDDHGKMASDNGSSLDIGSGSSDTPKKESKMTKLKEKLHIHSKKSESDV
ncbi:putative glycine-rich cell wall structural protein 1 protein [Venturia nashicola]|uniref:Putative glycine-rich cell wall structural protein 1 protein n=1 Tax=Venturia nashicola TaxID=86259 RepID=A0A4Z1NY25_9PEZI|nr:putative glycine-rich cell wall structural protein 1 protein [Venturia nashicola]TLD28018.1 putative glycine-rich cell wall structural protein 1 protein [Venturia nashicola]